MNGGYFLYTDKTEWCIISTSFMEIKRETNKFFLFLINLEIRWLCRQSLSNTAK